MKTFPSVRIVQVGSGFIVIKEKVDELWLTPDDKMTYVPFYELDYKLRDFMEEENATE